MALDAQQRIFKLIKECNIHFDGIVDKESWPMLYEKTFAAIVSLGEIKFETYVASITVESRDRPWRAQVKGRAQRITELANRCLERRKNEPGWRMNVESEILARFTIEVSW